MLKILWKKKKKMYIPFKLRKMLMIRLVIWRSGSFLSSFLHRIMMILCFQRYLPPCFLCLCLMQISSHLYKNEKSVCPHKWGFWIRQWFLHLAVKLDDVGTDQNPWSHALEEGVEEHSWWKFRIADSIRRGGWSYFSELEFRGDGWAWLVARAC